MGGGDFDAMGQALLRQLRAFAALTPTSAVLDIGCATGRLAQPLSSFLAPNTLYVGFDVSSRAVASCRRRVGLAHPNLTFLKADIRNREYNPRGAVAEEAYDFPAPDGAVKG